MSDQVYTVTELQRAVRHHLEEGFGDVSVQGEISDLTLAASGHAYFTLKDEGAILRCVMWRSTVQRLRFRPEEGLAVRARGHLTIYEPKGSYQMIVEGLEPVGAGPLQVAFEQLVRRLRAEGLFEEAHKVPIPSFPRRIAVVTSPQGAVLRDIARVAFRRWPSLEILVVPTRVQGEGASAEIAAAIGLADTLGADVLVVARGGGSLEDLWAFNEEPVARAIYAAETPVVSAVGHETDTTIADFVADLRAPTPSAAAEMIAPSRDEARRAVDDLRHRMGRSLQRTAAEARARLETLLASPAFRRPLERIRAEEQRLDDLAERIRRTFREGQARRRSEVGIVGARLQSLSPLRVLERGFSVTTRGGRVVKDAADLRPGEEISTLLARGRVVSRVLGTEESPPRG